MAFITRSQIQAYERGFSISNDSVVSKQAEAFASKAAIAQVSIFLSYSSKDRELIKPAIAFLCSHGVRVYIDFMDEGMPDAVSGETAKRIKEKIREQKKFMVMVTENSKDSRWVPWELGFADPVKGIEHVAILPISESGTFVQNEYMRIYPKIEFVNGTWYVWQDDPSYFLKLTDWLRK